MTATSMSRRLDADGLSDLIIGAPLLAPYGGVFIVLAGAEP